MGNDIRYITWEHILQFLLIPILGAKMYDHIIARQRNKKSV
jgi:hypothetical protein